MYSNDDLVGSFYTVVLHYVLDRWSSWSFYVQFHSILYSNEDLIGRFMYNFISLCTQTMI